MRGNLQCYDEYGDSDAVIIKIDNHLDFLSNIFMWINSYSCFIRIHTILLIPYTCKTSIMGIR